MKLPVEVPGKLLFWGVAGSRGFNLADEDSDTDYKGVYVATTRDFFKFDKPPECVVNKSPDVEIDEIEKFLKLVCKGNHHHIEFMYFEPQYIGHTKLYLELERMLPHIVPRDDYFNCIKGICSKARYELEQVHLGNYSKPIDYKMISHAVRILGVASKFMTTRVMNLRAEGSERDLLLEIKYGEHKPTPLLRLVDERFRVLDNAYHNSVLRKKANIEKAEIFLDKVRRNHEFYKSE